MTEHGFLAAMLALVAAEVLVLEGVTAVIYLEARKIISQIR